jgi:hypothetical protein
MTDDITTFTLLRVVQGLCMSTAFTLTRPISPSISRLARRPARSRPT